ncbi:Na+/H+ antiporter family protein [Halomonas campaniensis]|uniref:Sodium:proton antiporter n=1 Tax=Halomonas campaniensis TaxID=213554 RepID=A0A246S4W9_9GAMM|nr:Na+/H+ antiporter NhaC family protein [Halomonas campaniensis]OWV31496.1 sodium:proton antiporter [Halomonas campaniensis]
MNAVVLTISLMIMLCLLQTPVAIALITAALIGGLHSGLEITDAIAAFNDSLLIGSQVGITYIMIGAFAVALARSGLLDLLAHRIALRLDLREGATNKGIKWVIFLTFIAASVMSQNLVPVHIAFIPILIPPLLGVMNKLHVDRRAVACILACSISASYLLLPTGFGAIYLNEILLANVNDVGQAYGLTATASMVPKAMFLPVMGILLGMCVAVFYTYRKPREYQTVPLTDLQVEKSPITLNLTQCLSTLVALAVALICQLKFDSLLVGAMIGFIILSFTGIFRWREQDDVFTEGLRMMAQIAVIITIASGFSGVLNATGEIAPLVAATADMIGGNMALGAALMLLVGLFITIGFGDSFASVPILASIYVPLALTLGFSPMATIALLGAAAALGDAGSPASTITLGATAGLNADGQHDHIKDSVLPTFSHANFGMLVFAWAASMLL